MSAGESGFAAVDYLGAVVLVAVLMAALVAVRPHEPSRKPPVNPAGAIAKLVVAPVTRPRPIARRRARPTPRRRVRPRPRPPRVVVDVPRWATGW